MICARCGEENVASKRPHESVDDCVHALRFAVAGLTSSIVRAELEAAAARREVQGLKSLLQRIRDIARPEVGPMALPALMRRIRKIATGQPSIKRRSSAA
jgi:hypothetical protein